MVPIAEPVPYFCILRPVKGRELRGLKVWGRSGTRLRVLDSGETSRLVLDLLETRLRSALVVRPGHDDRPDLVAELIERYAPQIAHQPPVPMTSAERDAELERIAVEVAAALGAIAPAGTTAEPMIARLADGIATAVVRRFVVVELQPADAGLIAYEQVDVFSRTGPHSSRRQRTQRWLSEATGALPNHLTFPLYKARQAQEYAWELATGTGRGRSARPGTLTSR